MPVGDDWVTTPTEPIRFPFNGEVVANAPVGDSTIAQLAVTKAVSVRRAMAKLPSRVRRQWLRDTHAFVSARREEFERLLVLETGKPLRDCKVEVGDLAVVPTHVIERVEVEGRTLNFITDNYLIATWS